MCNRLTGYHLLYLNKHLSEENRQMYEEHLKGCEDCQKTHELFKNEPQGQANKLRS